MPVLSAYLITNMYKLNPLSPYPPLRSSSRVSTQLLIKYLLCGAMLNKNVCTYALALLLFLPFVTKLAHKNLIMQPIEPSLMYFCSQICAVLGLAQYFL